MEADGKKIKYAEYHIFRLLFFGEIIFPCESLTLLVDQYRGTEALSRT